MRRLWQRKTKEEIEIERRIRTRKAKALLSHYIKNLEHLQKKVFLLGKEAAKISDEQLIHRYASHFIALGSRVQQAKKLSLLMEEAELQSDLVKISASFINFSKDIADTIAEGPEVQSIMRTQAQFEKAMMKVENIEAVLNSVVDSTSENILSSGNFNGETIDEVTALFEGENAREAEIDGKIDKKIEEIERLMKE